MSTLLEWLGCFSGLLGAALLALNSRHSGYGFVAFLASNLCWIGYGVQTNAWGMIAMQPGFTVTSVLGIYRWFPGNRARAIGKT